MKPITGFGLGLRREHYATILADRPAVHWFEILTENYLVPGGRPMSNLEQVRSRYSVVMHGVSMSIGSAGVLNRRYLKDLSS